MHTFLLSTVLLAIGNSCPFDQSIEIDTNKRLLQITPDYTTEQALEAHKDLEKRIKRGAYDIVSDFYLLFRYRDDTMIPIWLKVITENPENELLRIWFITALSQMQTKTNLRFVAPFKGSENGILRECAANAYGFLAPPDSLASLERWFREEPNCYVRSTVEASIQMIRRGGYKSQVPYLPKYYSGKPRRIRFLYNKQVLDDPECQFEVKDTGSGVLTSARFCFPHQQYQWRLRNAPKAGYFGRRSGPIFHIGIDSGWLLEGLPVHAVGDGIVKETGHSLSWGNLVVIESRTREGDTVCAVYGHLSPFLNVAAGDTVRTGAKIGQIGSSVSYDNGGYWAHLHFGIEKGSFGNAGIAGYDQDTSTYENPMRYIESHR